MEDMHGLSKLSQAAYAVWDKAFAKASARFLQTPKQVRGLNAYGIQ